MACAGLLMLSIHSAHAAQCLRFAHMPQLLANLVVVLQVLHAVAAGRLSVAALRQQLKQWRHAGLRREACALLLRLLQAPAALPQRLRGYAPQQSGLPTRRCCLPCLASRQCRRAACRYSSPPAVVAVSSALLRQHHAGQSSGACGRGAAVAARCCVTQARPLPIPSPAPARGRCPGQPLQQRSLARWCGLSTLHQQLRHCHSRQLLSSCGSKAG